MSGVRRDTSGDAMREAFAAPAPPEVPPTDGAMRALWGRLRFMREAFIEAALICQQHADNLKTPHGERRRARAHASMCNAHAVELDAIEKRARRAAENNGSAADR
jgi:hypothetical protein